MTYEYANDAEWLQKKMKWGYTNFVGNFSFYLFCCFFLKILIFTHLDIVTSRICIMKITSLKKIRLIPVIKDKQVIQFTTVYIGIG